MPARCEVCDVVIEEERAKLIAMSGNRLPCVCLEHSTVTKPKGLMDFGHKTAGEVVILPNDAESQRRAFRQYHRAR
jgi:hypothetical protein